MTSAPFQDVTEAFPEVPPLPKPLIPGTLDEGIHNRVKNPDGSISTVRTMSFNDGNGEVLIPTVVDGKILSDDAAIEHYRKTGQHFGIFASPEDATTYALDLHSRHEKLLGAGK